MKSEEIAIEVKNISKLYRIGMANEGSENLVGSLASFIKSPFKNFKKYRSLYSFKDIDISQEGKFDTIPSNVICAVNDVSFKVGVGEVVGIIGSNGAGKSTLLKILSRITHPTRGRIIAKGKISSLLEVGTGFHPELTGKENIYLNGTILGMRKTEIDQKYDQIVEFSGVGKFINTPVKRYSSGMQVRLAFSVSAHLDPDILIVDEVLAVGDAEFQKKCIGRMDTVAKKGKTVLFVSHDMRAIAKLCNRVILLKSGSIKDEGPPQKIIERYLSNESMSTVKWSSPEKLHGENTDVKLVSAEVLSTGGDEQVVTYNSGFNVMITYNIFKNIENLVVFVRLSDPVGNDIWTSWDTDGSKIDTEIRQPGQYTSKCKVPPRIMKPGQYRLHIGTMVPGVKSYEFIENVLHVDVSDVDYLFNRERVGIITPLMEWEISKNGSGIS